jgi:hypothetical protein
MTEHSSARWASLTWLDPNTIEIRFMPGILLDRAAITEVITARKFMQGDRSVGLLLIVPAETELDVAIIGTDHQRVNQAEDKVVGFAVVARSAVSQVLLRLYKAYYPPTFEAEVFTDEGHARTWLKAKVARALEPSNG